MTSILSFWTSALTYLMKIDDACKHSGVTEIVSKHEHQQTCTWLECKSILITKIIVFIFFVTPKLAQSSNVKMENCCWAPTVVKYSNCSKQRKTRRKWWYPWAEHTPLFMNLIWAVMLNYCTSVNLLVMFNVDLS